jgi:hypothetical protein
MVGTMRRPAVDAMLTKWPAPLRPEHGQGSRDAVQDALDVDVDHRVPVVDAQVVQRGHRHDASVADEHVQPTEPLVRQRDEVGHILPAPHVDAQVGDVGRVSEPRGERGQPVLAPCAKHQLRAA